MVISIGNCSLSVFTMTRNRDQAPTSMDWSIVTGSVCFVCADAVATGAVAARASSVAAIRAGRCMMGLPESADVLEACCPHD